MTEGQEEEVDAAMCISVHWQRHRYYVTSVSICNCLAQLGGRAMNLTSCLFLKLLCKRGATGLGGARRFSLILNCKVDEEYRKSFTIKRMSISCIIDNIIRIWCLLHSTAFGCTIRLSS